MSGRESRTRLRVAFLGEQAAASGGWGRYLVEVVDAVRAHGVEPLLLTAPGPVDPALAGVERHQVLAPLFVRRLQTPRSLLAAGRIARLMAGCDVVHCLAEPYLPLAARAAAGRPLVMTAHGTWAVRPFASLTQRLFFAPALRRVDLLVCQSRHTRDAMARVVDLPPHEVLPGAVRPEAFAAPAETPLPAWSGNGPVLLSVGQVKPRKGIHVSIEALARLRPTHPDATLVVVGAYAQDDPYVARLEALARERGVRDAVHLAGAISEPELRAWYQRAAIVLMPSRGADGRFEGLGLVYAEAAAAGVPAIGTRECGASEVIVDGETGLLVPQDDPESTAHAAARLLDDAALRERMGSAGRRRALELSWTRLAAALADRYRSLAAAGGPAS